MRSLLRFVSIAALAAAVLPIAGCVSTPIEPETEATFFVTRAGDTVTVSWVSEPDKVYTILYTTDRSGKVPWVIAAGGDSIRGNGDQITFVEKIPPDEQRYYRVQIDPLRK